MRASARVVAVLGPTNTGKTHYAIERMLAHRTGVIGLPLRLLAREVYDRIVAARGPSVVALVTGEERIVPDRTRYWVCTVEAMPPEIGADFVAIDEIQLCADPERGHVFTNRLLKARGLHETLFLGSESMRGAIAALVPNAAFVKRDRLSQLGWAGSRKISRMPPRSAIVGFSVENVYAIAELIRRQKGGCAVVMGALSPRTRNAQVALYQNGDVDYLVATDAIGMGLNLDIRHVAFAATAKFDGRRMRPLFPHEIGQIAGRAGRHTDNGSFGVTGEAHPFDEELIDAIENHRFAPVRKLHWRNDVPDFGTPERLIGSLEAPTSNDWLTRARDSDDVLALKALSAMPEIRDRLRGPRTVRLLWDVCRIPDFRSVSEGEHAGLLARIFGFLADKGQVPTDWFAANIARIDKTDGDIDALSKRLAYIRTWTYVAQRKGWVADESHWRDGTRAVEDRLSDALHARLTQRFVDRRTSVLLRRLKQKESLVAEVNDKGEVAVEGEFAGRLEGFRFRQDASASPDGARTLRQAAYEALKPEFHLRADRFYNAPDTELDFTEQGGLMWGSSVVGKLVAGAEAMKPQVEAFVDEEAGFDVADKVRRRLQHFIDRKVATQFEPLLAMGRDDAIQGLARGLAFRLVEGMGVLPRDGVAGDVKSLDQELRAVLRRHGVRFGQFTIFLPPLLKPAPTRLRLVLWSLAKGLHEFPESPPPGLVTIPYLTEVPKNHYTLAGYHPAGSRAIRIDMLERLADLLRAKDSRAGFEATPEMLSITGMTLDQFAGLMAGLGYRGEKSERPKVRPEAAAAVPAPAGAATEGATVAAPVDVGAGADAGTEPPAADAVQTPGGGAVVPPSDAEPALAGAEAAPATAVEMESFYTFVWAPRARGGESRGPRRARPEARGHGPKSAAPAPAPAPAQEDAAAPATAGDRPSRPDRPRNDRPGGGERRKDGPRGQSDGFKGKPKPKGGKPGTSDDRPERPERSDRPRDTQPKVFEARPPREQKVDPDSPFAVLAALRTRI
ncbi:MAG: helicase [Rhodobacter sp.]|nr:helicase [Rhodobacter sp.]MCA3521122.1 helicase [Rhodobacter sp.]MCA3521941.1 helicase [Rhodobacter sp.]MCA3527464.1 helicase [Rhodobacter sp.]MCA3530850.1 helicase [Rhodobacter sp.]